MDLKYKYYFYLIGVLCLTVTIILIAIKINGRNKSSNNASGSTSGSVSNNTSNSKEGSKDDNVSKEGSKDNEASKSSNTKEVNENSKVSDKPTVKTPTVNSTSQDMNKNQAKPKEKDQPTNTKETSRTPEVLPSTKVETPVQILHRSQENNNPQNQEQVYRELTKKQVNDLILMAKKELMDSKITEEEKKKVFTEFETLTKDLNEIDTLKKLDDLKIKITKGMELVKSGERSWVGQKWTGLTNVFMYVKEKITKYVVYLFELFKLNIMRPIGMVVDAYDHFY